MIAIAAAVLFGLMPRLLAAAEKPSSIEIIPPPPAREFRATWIATVGNSCWPSKPGLSMAQQKAELIALLDRAAALKLNAVIFQVRPACDALYSSRLEPWSEYLTGVQGRARVRGRGRAVRGGGGRRGAAAGGCIGAGRPPSGAPAPPRVGGPRGRRAGCATVGGRGGGGVGKE